MTPAEISEIKGRLSKATPGPWTMKPSEGQCDCVLWDTDQPHDNREDCPNWEYSCGADVDKIFTIDSGDYYALNDNDAEFISHARQDIPNLLTHISELTGKTGELEAKNIELSEKIGQLEDIKSKQFERIEFIRREDQRRINFLEARVKAVTDQLFKYDLFTPHVVEIKVGNPGEIDRIKSLINNEETENGRT